MSKEYKIKAFYSNFFSDDLIAYVCLRIIYNFNNKEIDADVMGLSSNDTVKKFRSNSLTTTRNGNKQNNSSIYRDAIPLWLWRSVNKILSVKQLKKIAEWRFARSLREGDIVYLWPDASVQLHEKLKSSGYIIVTEMINTLESTSKKILDKEFTSLNMPITHNITEDEVNNAIKKAKLSDYLYCPSPAVASSLLEVGIQKNKILNVSYGLKKSEIIDVPKNKFRRKKITALFVGSVCIRKGIHLLLQAWVDAKVDGKLLIVGKITQEIKEYFLDYLKRNPTIQHIDYVEDLRPIYAKADFFILPSLEEGSPLVTYLALGAALPMIVSPMGSGGVVKDGREGFVIDPHDIEAIVYSIRKFSKDPKLRYKMSVSSGQSADNYTWDKVSEKRIKVLCEKFK